MGYPDVQILLQVVKDVNSRGMCVGLCMEETSFSCKSVDYGVNEWNKFICMLSDETHFDIPENYVQVKDYDYCVVGRQPNN